MFWLFKVLEQFLWDLIIKNIIVCSGLRGNFIRSYLFFSFCLWCFRFFFFLLLLFLAFFRVIRVTEIFFLYCFWLFLDFRFWEILWIVPRTDLGLQILQLFIRTSVFITEVCFLFEFDTTSHLFFDIVLLFNLQIHLNQFSISIEFELDGPLEKICRKIKYRKVAFGTWSVVPTVQWHLRGNIMLGEIECSSFLLFLQIFNIIVKPIELLFIAIFQFLALNLL